MSWARGALGGAALAAAGALAACSADRVEVITVASESLRMGMLAHWSCDDEAGAKLIDHSGDGHDGNLLGPTFTTGRFGRALHFESGTWVSVPDFPQAASSWSVALWYRAPTAELGEPLTLASNELPTGGGWTMDVLLTQGEGKYRFGYAANGARVEVESNRLHMGGFDHVAAVLDAHTWKLSLFENGELASSTAMTSTIAPGATTLLLGRAADNRRFLVGDVDDVVVFDRALVAAEVSALARAPAPSLR